MYPQPLPPPSPLSTTSTFYTHSTATSSVLTQSFSVEDLYGAPTRPRNYKQWEEVAKKHTQEIKQFGSPSPLVWVLVKGKDIPANALVAGEEKRQPLYIARTFYEGGLVIGKAGRQLEKGFSFAYSGREVHAETYEVLVPALQPLRYQISETVYMPKIPRLVRETQRPLTPKVERLNLIKTVILIDDSASMSGTLWHHARDALAGIVEINSKVSAEGIDLFFMNNTKYGLNLKVAADVRGLFESVEPIGETPIGQKLGELFERYLPLVEDSFNQHRPITLVVITDGVPTDEPEEVIIAAARRLDLKQVPLKQFGVHFTQIGDDLQAAEFLRELDNDLYVRHGCRDIVDATPFRPHDQIFNTEKMVQILLRSVDRASGVSAHPTSSYSHNVGLMGAGNSGLQFPKPMPSHFVDPRTRTTSLLSSSSGVGIGTSTYQAERSSSSFGYRSREVHSEMHTSLSTPPPKVALPLGQTSVQSLSTSHESQVLGYGMAPRPWTPKMERFNLIKMAFLIDDSVSMEGARWMSARDALAGLVEMNSKVSAEGVDLFFMNERKHLFNIRDAIDVRNLFDSVVPSGGTPVGRRLRELCEYYLRLVEDPHRQHRPVALVVITDSVPTDPPEDVIIATARRLDRNQIPLKQFGIHFAQIGEDVDATQYLKNLDNNSGLRYGCRDIVTTTPFKSEDKLFNTEKMAKILMGVIDKNTDPRASPLSSTSSPLVVPVMSPAAAVAPLSQPGFWE